ncbi:hypothetical protein ACS3UN_09940 [Oscillospiraceae bacterium LTW-04]|nr:hypothetical protein RBH76_11690 [Oscillospiraceae bacterium MB24-C1]
MNSRAKKKLTRSWQDRDWNRNRKCWHRFPVPLGQSCWVLVTNDENQWQPIEKKLAGIVEIYVLGLSRKYAVRDVDGDIPGFVYPHDLFESFEQADQEAERRNRQQ